MKESALSTADMQEQWQQYLTSGSGGDATDVRGLAWVPGLAAVRFQGSNAREFLQGYLTSDMRRLRPDTLVPTALCDLKGRVVVNGWCAPENEEDVLLVLHATLVETLAEFLKPYLAFSRHTDLVDLRSEVVLLASLDLDGADGGLVLDHRRRLFPAPGLEKARALWESHPHVSGEAWLASVTADGIPLISAPVSGTFLPQMLGLDALGAIDFDKGCYLGQEVVARAQHRGEVKRRLTRTTWEGPVAPAPGEAITDAEGKAWGEVVQSATEHAGTGPLLAVVRRNPPQDLRHGETRIRLR